MRVRCIMSSQVTPGQEYGQLTVLESCGMRSNHTYYKCRCQCGAEVEARGSRLLAGKKSSCVKCAAAMRRIGKYYTGYRVVDYLRSDTSTSYIVECIVCRSRYTATGSELRRLPACSCQKRRDEIIASGKIDRDLLDQLL